jgi:hypothetical protein
VLTVQFHPELTSECVALNICLRRDLGILSKDVASNALGLLQRDTDEEWFGGCIVKFFARPPLTRSLSKDGPATAWEVDLLRQVPSPLQAHGEFFGLSDEEGELASAAAREAKEQDAAGIRQAFANSLSLLESQLASPLDGSSMFLDTAATEIESALVRAG